MLDVWFVVESFMFEDGSIVCTVFDVFTSHAEANACRDKWTNRDVGTRLQGMTTYTVSSAKVAIPADADFIDSRFC